METPNALTTRLAQQIDQLLAHLDAKESDNLCLRQELHSLAQERDALQARLQTARIRLDTLLERLPSIQTALESGQ
ncbi:DUF904 domain-containing protein [Vandammella animalimorsus]|uniref:DUF904 domain-containing protein n=1 Tax=Vandammella animalimorsus TaxID=2029117 RepID=UPI0031BAA441